MQLVVYFQALFYYLFPWQKRGDRSRHKVRPSTNNHPLRELVSNFRESGDRSKNSNFVLFAQKDPFGESFSKIIFKRSSEFLFWKKIRKFEIGQDVPNLHNFYWAFSTFSQRSYKTTKKLSWIHFFISCFSYPGVALQLYFISNWTFFRL